jgi:hypothetical protein
MWVAVVHVEEIIHLSARLNNASEESKLGTPAF